MRPVSGSAGGFVPRMAAVLMVVGALALALVVVRGLLGLVTVSAAMSRPGQEPSGPVVPPEPTPPR